MDLNNSEDDGDENVEKILISQKMHQVSAQMELPSGDRK